MKRASQTQKYANAGFVFETLVSFCGPLRGPVAAIFSARLCFFVPLCELG
jgi:hypothetical protein